MKQEERIKIKNMYIEHFKKSWTYNKLTDPEKKQFKELFNWKCIETETIKHATTKRDVGMIMNGLYHAFLLGVGYNNFNWRE